MALLLTACCSLTAVIVLVFINRLYALFKNYRAARLLNIPIIVRFESWQDPLWMLLGPKIRSFLSSIGLWDPTAIDYTTIGWTQADRFASHAQHGPAFALVTPFKTNVMISDVNASRDLFKDWRAFVKNEDLYNMFNAYGRNVNSANGDDWPRHRKVTAPAFKEANSKLVWKATLTQVSSVVRKWMGEGTTTLRGLRGDTEKIAMHVLMSAAFGRDYDFDTGVKVVEPGHKISFGEAMHTCIGSLAIMLVPLTFATAKLPAAVIPAGMKKLQVAVQEVRSYLSDSVDAERDALRNGVAPKDNLISTLVRANEEEKKGEEGKKLALTDDELYGNLFIFNLAGHETTSSSLSFAIPLLAIYPDVQKWIRAEVDAVFQEYGTEDYSSVFPMLVRTLALMYETQRFFSAIPMHPKYTGEKAQVLRVNGVDIHIPPETFVSINYNAIHFDPAVWGSDVDEFRPSRWIKSAGGPGKEQFATPDGAEFVGWSSGPRACPGKRFSQVEFVAAISTLLRECELQPAKMHGEWKEEASDRLRAAAFDVEHFISLKPRNPDAGCIAFAKRTDL